MEKDKEEEDEDEAWGLFRILGSQIERHSGEEEPEKDSPKPPPSPPEEDGDQSRGPLPACKLARSFEEQRPPSPEPPSPPKARASLLEGFRWFQVLLPCWWFSRF